ncbi:hypothetical protein U3516DRAFT_914873 [Neocallimastix sp. 'constans']|jgi:hypothetical protein
MNQMPQTRGGSSPYQQEGAFANGGFNAGCNNTQRMDEYEYEYVSNDDKYFDYVEDKYGNIYNIEEAQRRGLIEPDDFRERGISNIIGKAALEGYKAFKSELKKRKKIKKIKKLNSFTTTSNYGPQPSNYGPQPSNYRPQPYNQQPQTSNHNTTSNFIQTTSLVVGFVRLGMDLIGGDISIPDFY